MVKLAQLLGWTLARLPRSLTQAFVEITVRLFCACSPDKLRIAESNLHHAFPDKDIKWIKLNARKSILQLVETSLYSLASPYLIKEQLHKYIHFGEEAKSQIQKALDSNRPIILAAPHMGCWEAITLLPALVDLDDRKLASLYRPLRNPKFDHWVKTTRELHGFQMLSRAKGLNTVLKILRGKGIVGILFDQHTNDQGSLISFMNRCSSATPIVGLLAKKFNCGIIFLVAERKAFWKYEAHIEYHEIDNQTEEGTVYANRWLEHHLYSNPNKAYSWLWAHRRWKIHFDISNQFNLNSKSSLLSHYDKNPKGHRLLVVLPESPKDVDSSLALLPVIQAARPDTEATLLGSEGLRKQALATSPSAAYLSLDNTQGNYTQLSSRIRDAYFDTVLVLDETPQWDRLIKIARCKYTLGLVRPGLKRPAIRNLWQSPHPSPPSDRFAEWIALLQAFGLPEDTPPPRS